MADEMERFHLQRTARWERIWADDATRIADDCYAPDCIVTDMLTGDAVHGRSALQARERDVQRLNGPRRMQITRMVASGDKVAVQMDVVWQDRRAKACAFLTFDTDGLITVDNWYGEGAAGRGSPAALRRVLPASPMVSA